MERKKILNQVILSIFLTLMVGVIYTALYFIGAKIHMVLLEEKYGNLYNKTNGCLDDTCELSTECYDPYYKKCSGGIIFTITIGTVINISMIGGAICIYSLCCKRIKKKNTSELEEKSLNNQTIVNTNEDNTQTVFTITENDELSTNIGKTDNISSEDVKLSVDETKNDFSEDVKLSVDETKSASNEVINFSSGEMKSTLSDENNGDNTESVSDNTYHVSCGNGNTSNSF